MNLGLAGKAVIVTGASRGIGRSIAEHFAAEGSRLALCARSPEPLAETADALRKLGSEVYAAACDVADAAALDRFLSDSRAALGAVDVLVNNASGLRMGEDDESWRASFDVDLMGAVRASRRVEPWLRERSGGAIVHLASTAALEAPAPAAYAAAKAALISYSKNSAIRLAPEGIRVNCVAPGSIEFPGGIWARVRHEDPELYTTICRSIPSGRLGTAEEVARAVVFLASEAASWITGTVLSVDGGQHKANL